MHEKLVELAGSNPEEFQAEFLKFINTIDFESINIINTINFIKFYESVFKSNPPLNDWFWEQACNNGRILIWILCEPFSQDYFLRILDRSSTSSKIQTSVFNLISTNSLPLEAWYFRRMIIESRDWKDKSFHEKIVEAIFKHQGPLFLLRTFSTFDDSELLADIFSIPEFKEVLLTEISLFNQKDSYDLERPLLLSKMINRSFCQEIVEVIFKVRSPLFLFEIFFNVKKILDFLTDFPELEEKFFRTVLYPEESSHISTLYFHRLRELYSLDKIIEKINSSDEGVDACVLLLLNLGIENEILYRYKPCSKRITVRTLLSKASHIDVNVNKNQVMILVHFLQKIIPDHSDLYTFLNEFGDDNIWDNWTDLISLLVIKWVAIHGEAFLLAYNGTRSVDEKKINSGVSYLFTQVLPLAARDVRLSVLSNFSVNNAKSLLGFYYIAVLQGKIPFYENCIYEENKIEERLEAYLDFFVLPFCLTRLDEKPITHWLDKRKKILSSFKEPGKDKIKILLKEKMLAVLSRKDKTMITEQLLFNAIYIFTPPNNTTLLKLKDCFFDPKEPNSTFTNIVLELLPSLRRYPELAFRITCFLSLHEQKKDYTISLSQAVPILLSNPNRLAEILDSQLISYTNLEQHLVDFVSLPKSIQRDRDSYALMIYWSYHIIKNNEENFPLETIINHFASHNSINLLLEFFNEDIKTQADKETCLKTWIEILKQDTVSAKFRNDCLSGMKKIVKNLEENLNLLPLIEAKIPDSRNVSRIFNNRLGDFLDSLRTHSRPVNVEKQPDGDDEKNNIFGL